MHTITVSLTNGTTRTEIATEAAAAEFLRRYGDLNASEEMHAAGLDPEGYDSALELLAALSETLPSGEVLTLP